MGIVVYYMDARFQTIFTLGAIALEAAALEAAPEAAHETL